MKKTLLFLIISLCSTFVFGQKYVPFPIENAEWHVNFIAGGDDSPPTTYLLNYYIEGDTILNTKTYHKIYSNSYPKRIKGGIREENKRIYYLDFSNSGGYLSHIKSMSNQIKECVKRQMIALNDEYLLYDFNKTKVGDTLFVYPWQRPALITNIDSVLIQKTYRKRYEYNSIFHGSDYVIEGIGSVKEGLFGAITSIPACGSYNWQLVCFSQNGESIYKNPIFKDCNSTQKWSDLDYLKTGTQWYYGKKDYIYSQLYMDNYFCVKITGDTIINGQNCKVMNHLRSGPSCFGYDSRVAIYQSNDSVYFYNTTSKKFSTLYVYGANKGDSWIIEYPTSKVTVTVDSIGSVFNLTKWSKVQYVNYSTVYPNYDNMTSSYTSKIIEGIGDFIYFFRSNIYYLMLCDDLFTDYTGLRCYVHPDYGTYHVTGTLDCTYITSEVKSPTDKPVKGYINTTDKLIIESESLSEPCTFELMDIRGSVMLRTQVSASQNTVNVSQLTKGLYLYRLRNNEITLGTGKIVKQ